jgi:predicted transcriptional regulator
MEMKRVGEVMVPLEKFPHIPHWFTLRQALAELDRAESEALKNTPPTDGAGCLPWVIMVFSAQNELLGMLNRQDLLRGLRPEMMANQPNHYQEKMVDVKIDADLLTMSFSCDKAMASLKRQIEQPVSEFLSPIETTVGRDDYLLETIYKMIDRNLSLVPVVQDGRIVGVVYALDALREMTKLLI